MVPDNDKIYVPGENDPYFSDEEEHVAELKQKPTRTTTVELMFPAVEMNEMIFQDRDSLWIYLRRLSRERAKFYKIVTNSAYMYLMCKHCDSKITLKREMDVWKVLKFNSLHSHILENNKGLQEKEILSFMEENGYSYETEGIELLLLDKFKISKRRFAYLKQKVLNTKDLLSDFLTKLQDDNKRAFIGPWMKDEPAPEYVLHITVEMYKNYLRFGDCVRFDITYSLCRIRSKQNKRWNVGIFSGFNENLSPLIFGLLIIKSETLENFVACFDKFFELMGKLPKSFITDQQHSIQSALQIIAGRQRGRFVHLLDQFHIMKALRKKFKKETERADVQFVRELMYSRDWDTVNNANENLKAKYGSQPWFNEYWRKISKWSIYHAPRHFFGLSITTSPTEKINDLIKSKIKTETTIQVIVRKVEDLANQLNIKPVNIIKNPLMKCFKDVRLKQIQYRLGPRIFQRLTTYYLEAIQMRITAEEQEQNPPRYKICLRNGNMFESLVTAEYCPCGIIQQEQLPCPHMLTVYRAERALKLQKKIHSRWLFERRQEGRPKIQAEI